MGYNDLVKGEYELSACKKCGGLYIHDFACVESKSDKQDPLYAKLQAVRNSMFALGASGNIVMTFDDTSIDIYNVSRWFIEGLKGTGWLGLSKQDFGKKNLRLHDFYIDWTDDKPWADKYCINWFYETYGYSQVKIVCARDFYPTGTSINTVDQMKNDFLAMIKQKYSS